VNLKIALVVVNGLINMVDCKIMEFSKTKMAAER